MTNSFINRWIELGHNKVNELGATLTSTTMVVDGIDDRWSMADWSTLLGMIYVISMIIPRIFQLYLWIKQKIEENKSNR